MGHTRRFYNQEGTRETMYIHNTTEDGPERNVTVANANETYMAYAIPLSRIEPVKSTLHVKQACINGEHVVQCLVDSGSPTCLIRETTAKGLQLNLKPDTTVIVGFGTDARTPVVGRATVQIKIDKVTLSDVPVYVVLYQNCSRDKIIGRSWCEHPTIAFVKLDDQLTFYHVDDFPFAEAPKVLERLTEDVEKRANLF